MKRDYGRSDWYDRGALLVDDWISISKHPAHRDCGLCEERAARGVVAGLLALERYKPRAPVDSLVYFSAPGGIYCGRVVENRTDGAYVRRLDGVPGPCGPDRLHYVYYGDILDDRAMTALRPPSAPEVEEPITDQEAKEDATKRNWDMLLVDCAPALDAVMTVLEVGAEKYGAGTTWKTVAPERYKRAATRHLIASLRGEKINIEDGSLYHLAQAITDLLFALTNELEKKP
jgi:hypothetical protein